MSLGQNIGITIAEEVITIASNLLLSHFTNLTVEDQAKFKESLATSPDLPKTLLPGLGIFGIISLIVSLIGKLFPGSSETDKYKFILALQDSLNQTTLAQGQNAINVVETELAKGSTNFWIQLFWAGFRPVTAWICVIFFLFSMLKFVVATIASFFGLHIPIVPIESTTSYTMLSALLGLGAFRSFDKLNKTNPDK